MIVLGKLMCTVWLIWFSAHLKCGTLPLLKYAWINVSFPQKENLLCHTNWMKIMNENLKYSRWICNWKKFTTSNVIYSNCYVSKLFLQLKLFPGDTFLNIIQINETCQSTFSFGFFAIGNKVFFVSYWFLPQLFIKYNHCSTS